MSGPEAPEQAAAIHEWLKGAAREVKNRLSGLARRLGFHAVALVCAALLGKGFGIFLAYIGLLCLLPPGFSPRESRFLFPTAIGLGHFFPLWIWDGFSQDQALFIAGLQSWLLTAIIRRFRLGAGWLAVPALLVGALILRDTFPFPALAFATLCGAAAYACAAGYALSWARGKEQQGQRTDDPDEFEASISLLLEKKSRLPQELAAHTETLAVAAADILACIREDPEDRPAGRRFLSRYLPAAHKILDERLRLEERAGHARMRDGLESGAAMLERLAAAFQEEHGHLLRNDLMRFNAEMNTLDKLLKMDGR
ncbi:MAG: 5-bromo-4-chloroindolyl phosphate hydrolysis family protein [Desulfovibrionaceae bacterium]|nr:5-bromo-4-chloroindolyl phosphate hydrolysis family protein [Desulfovibrionaceae bacterium]